jgi:hypothetical protein
MITYNEDQELVIGDRVRITCGEAKGLTGYIVEHGRMQAYAGWDDRILEAFAVKIDGEDVPLWVDGGSAERVI